MRITLTTSAWIEHEPTWHAPNRSNSVTNETKITHRTAAWHRWLWGTLLAAGVSSAGAWERLVDVGGHRLRIECIGQGRPAAVLDHGLGGSASDWRALPKYAATIAPAMAQVSQGRTPDPAAASPPSCARCCLAPAFQVPTY